MVRFKDFPCAKTTNSSGKSWWHQASVRSVFVMNSTALSTILFPSILLAIVCGAMAVPMGENDEIVGGMVVSSQTFSGTGMQTRKTNLMKRNSSNKTMKRKKSEGKGTGDGAELFLASFQPLASKKRKSGKKTTRGSTNKGDIADLVLTSFGFFEPGGKDNEGERNGAALILDSIMPSESNEGSGKGKEKKKIKSMKTTKSSKSKVNKGKGKGKAKGKGKGKGKGTEEGKGENPTTSPMSFPKTLLSEPPTPTTRYLAEQTDKINVSSRHSKIESISGEEFKHIFDQPQNRFGSPRKLRDKNYIDSGVGDGDDKIDFENDDYYEGISRFALANISDPSKCECVDCEEDEVCGGLWKGNRYQEYSTGSTKIIHIVVSHCKSDLDWLNDFIGNRTVASIHIVTKCGYPVKGAPHESIIEVLPNIGRCDHTYAHFITTTLPQTIRSEDEDNSVVLFLKDDLSGENMHQNGHWNDFDSLVEIASSLNGFACGIVPDALDFGANRFFLSAYHEVKTLFEFSMNEYARNLKGYATNDGEFQSPYENLVSWFASLDAGIPSEIVQVCYGGVFSASVTNIKRRRMSVWKAIEKSLSRGNNIQEGHYAERSWASLLSTPLKSFQINALVENSDGVYLNPSSMHGALLKRPKLYIGIGVQHTTSIELLTDSLVEYKDVMEADGYKVVVHGKWDGGIHGFPNIDNLGACMWPDIDKALFPVYAKDATICPPDLLSDLTSFMEQSMKESKDVVLLNPWLVHPGSARSLQSYLDPAWDTKVVIYYRRYFEWIAMTFKGWRQEMRDYVLSPGTANIPLSTFRFIDFVREHCKRLFYGKDVNEDGFPVGQLSQIAHTPAIITNPMPRESTNGHVYQDQFDPVTDIDVKELTDLNEYTYFVAKEYYSFPRFRHGITIVNYHDIRGPETNFYCHVLSHAHRACKAALDKDRELLTSQTSLESQSNPTSPLSTTGYEYIPGLEPSKLYEEIVIAAYAKGRLKLRTIIIDPMRFRQQLSLWVEMIGYALEQKEIPLSNLPFECLYPFELNRLLEVSLEYEKYLLPTFFATPRGREGLEREFGKWRFCSVDTIEALRDRQWDFLFDDELQAQFAVPELPKAYIHIGAPKTGSTSIQDIMSLDRAILKEDKYFLALHGQHRQSGGGKIIQDNQLLDCDRIANCIWSQDEYDAVCRGKKARACACPEDLLPNFRTFSSNAIADKSGLVVSNEWLSRRTSETGLLTILDGWDHTIVLYYRRFYDWMISAHYQWHFDFSLALLEQNRGRIRLIDFFRRICRRLFSHQRDRPRNDRDQALINLIDIDEYTSEIWKRYNAVPEYDQKIKVVNFHKGDVVASFYCDVLDAKNACKTQKERLTEKKEKRTRTKKSTTFVDLAIGMYWGRNTNSSIPIHGTNHNDKPMTIQSFEDLADRIKKRLIAKGMKEADLPTECLTVSEQRLLLDFSLTVEKFLLPDDYASGGAEDMREDFGKAQAKNKFCSVDIDAILRNPEWQFLVDLEFTQA